MLKNARLLSALSESLRPHQAGINIPVVAKFIGRPPEAD